MKYIFETRMEVRDYECDIEGIVNNANYLSATSRASSTMPTTCTTPSTPVTFSSAVWASVSLPSTNKASMPSSIA